jgi:hypothetical protein
MGSGQGQPELDEVTLAAREQAAATIAHLETQLGGLRELKAWIHEDANFKDVLMQPSTMG